MQNVRLNDPAFSWKRYEDQYLCLNLSLKFLSQIVILTWENEEKKKKKNEAQGVCKVRRMGKQNMEYASGSKKAVIQSNQSMEVVVLYGLNVVLSAAK
ncbi:hypothetical protein ACJIZ3_012751 [Penstemon smallii]|uniref:Uncharacterized protein n=1 Tax=Penstemon smallii TaxID=265156 RepID=A0ABD3UMX9_9LAMI